MMTKPYLFMRKALYPRAFYSIALIAIGVFAAVVSGWLLAWLGFGSSGDSIGYSASSAVVLADAIDSDGGILRLDPDKVLARFDRMRQILSAPRFLTDGAIGIHFLTMG